MKKTVYYDYKKHYDFIKSDEAKDIFLNLEKEEWLRVNQDYQEEDLREIFSYDEEKKSIVKHFMRIGITCQDSMEILREQNKHSSYRDYHKFTSDFLRTLSLKKDLDPEYIYEHWQVEKLRFFDEMDRVVVDEDNEEYDHPNGFIFDSL